MNCENQHRFKLSDSHGNTLMVCVGLQPPTTGAASFRLVVESESVMHPLQLVSTSCNGASMELEMEMCSKRPSTRAPEEDDRRRRRRQQQQGNPKTKRRRTTSNIKLSATSPAAAMTPPAAEAHMKEAQPHFLSTQFMSALPSSPPSSSSLSSPIENGSAFSILPEELILTVFSKLSLVCLFRTVPLVCKQWWSLSRDESLWRMMFFRHIGRRLPSYQWRQPSVPCSSYSPATFPSTTYSAYAPSSSSTSPASSAHPLQHHPNQQQQQEEEEEEDEEEGRISPSWRVTAGQAMQQVRGVYASLSHARKQLSDRYHHEMETQTSLWLMEAIGWMVEEGYLRLLKAFLRDVARFTPPAVVRSALSDSRFLLRMAKSEYGGSAVSALLVSGADVCKALILAAMNRDLTGINSLFEAYVRAKRTGGGGGEGGEGGGGRGGRG